MLSYWQVLSCHGKVNTPWQPPDKPCTIRLSFFSTEHAQRNFLFEANNISRKPVFWKKLVSLTADTTYNGQFILYWYVVIPNITSRTSDLSSLVRYFEVLHIHTFECPITMCSGLTTVLSIWQPLCQVIDNCIVILSTTLLLYWQH